MIRPSIYFVYRGMQYEYVYAAAESLFGILPSLVQSRLQALFLSIFRVRQQIY